MKNYIITVKDGGYERTVNINADCLQMAHELCEEETGYCEDYITKILIE